MPTKETVHPEHQTIYNYIKPTLEKHGTINSAKVLKSISKKIKLSGVNFTNRHQREMDIIINEAHLDVTFWNKQRIITEDVVQLTLADPDILQHLETAIIAPRT